MIAIAENENDVTTIDTDFTPAELVEAAGAARRYYAWIIAKVIEHNGEYKPGATESVRMVAKWFGRNINDDLGTACVLFRFKNKHGATIPATDPTDDVVRELERQLEAAGVRRADARAEEAGWRKDRASTRREIVRSGDGGREYDKATDEGQRERREAATAAEADSDRLRTLLDRAKTMPSIRATVTSNPLLAAAVGLTIESKPAPRVRKTAAN